MVRILRTRGGLLPATLCAEAIRILDSHLNPAAMRTEIASLDENDPEWEMPYGMCWLLLLSKELEVWASVKDERPTLARATGTETQRRGWCAAVSLLANAVVRPRVAQWLSALVVPDRSSAHRNTAFSLSLLLEASSGDPLERQIREVATRLFGDDRDMYDPPPIDSRGRTAFLSPSVCQAYACRRFNWPVTDLQIL